MAQELLQGLLDTQNDRFEESWSLFFMDVSRVQKVTELLTPETSRQLLAAGQNWQGTNWNTSKASKVLYTLTGVPIVKAAWPEYRNAFLYALSLHLEVEILELELPDRVADAAFTLAQVFSGQLDWLPLALGTRVPPLATALFFLRSHPHSPETTRSRSLGTNLFVTFLWSWATCGPAPSLGSATWT